MGVGKCFFHTAFAVVCVEAPEKHLSPGPRGSRPLSTPLNVRPLAEASSLPTFPINPRGQCDTQTPAQGRVSFRFGPPTISRQAPTKPGAAASREACTISLPGGKVFCRGDRVYHPPCATIDCNVGSPWRHSFFRFACTKRDSRKIGSR